MPVLRDARPDHFLFTEGRVTGLVDFGAMGIDPVSADLARLLGEWIGRDEALCAAALGAYAEVRPIAPIEHDLIAPFERSSALLAGAGSVPIPSPGVCTGRFDFRGSSP